MPRCPTPLDASGGAARPCRPGLEPYRKSSSPGEDTGRNRGDHQEIGGLGTSLALLDDPFIRDGFCWFSLASNLHEPRSVHRGTTLPGKRKLCDFQTVHCRRHVTESVIETVAPPCTQITTGTGACTLACHVGAKWHRAALWQCGGHGLECRGNSKPSEARPRRRHTTSTPMHCTACRISSSVNAQCPLTTWPSELSMASSPTRRAQPGQESAQIRGAVVHVEPLDDASGGIQYDHRAICDGLLPRGRSCVSPPSRPCFWRRSALRKLRSSRPTRRQLRTSW